MPAQTQDLGDFQEARPYIRTLVAFILNMDFVEKKELNLELMAEQFEDLIMRNNVRRAFTIHLAECKECQRHALCSLALRLAKLL
jgi:hypothetical protein